MPVPHNWYATNRRISSPTVMRTRPTAPITVRTGREATSGLCLVWCLANGSPRSESASYTHRALKQLPGVKPLEARVPLVVRLRSAVCLLGRFPALAGVDLDVEAGAVLPRPPADRAREEPRAGGAPRDGRAGPGGGVVRPAAPSPRPRG